MIGTREMFANTIMDLDNGMNSALMTECERFGMTWGCREDCPVLEKGKCELYGSPDEFIKKSEVNNGK
jgi:hypothetical protein